MLYIDCLTMRKEKRDKPNHNTINPSLHQKHHCTTTRPNRTIIDPLPHLPYTQRERERERERETESLIE